MCQLHNIGSDLCAFDELEFVAVGLAEGLFDGCAPSLGFNASGINRCPEGASYHSPSQRRLGVNPSLPSSAKCCLLLLSQARRAERSRPTAKAVGSPTLVND